ncbi:MAG: hypothetical protein E7597_03910 [Ruminococcaceae bacterium]|nr:hypothetical protein [Oscillospiraceae bacterium]
MSNLDIRNAAANAGVKLWEIAEVYGISDTNFSKKLRRELPEPEKVKIFAIIEQIHSEKAAVSG